jgi:hypothetical protein
VNPHARPHARVWRLSYVRFTPSYSASPMAAPAPPRSGALRSGGRVGRPPRALRSYVRELAVVLDGDPLRDREARAGVLSVRGRVRLEGRAAISGATPRPLSCTETSTSPGRRASTPIRMSGWTQPAGDQRSQANSERVSIMRGSVARGAGIRPRWRSRGRDQAIRHLRSDDGGRLRVGLAATKPRLRSRGPLRDLSSPFVGHAAARRRSWTRMRSKLGALRPRARRSRKSA